MFGWGSSSSDNKVDNSAEIRRLEREIDKLEDEIEDIDRAITSLEVDVAQCSDSIERLDNSIRKYEEKISRYESQLRNANNDEKRDIERRLEAAKELLRDDKYAKNQEATASAKAYNKVRDLGIKKYDLEGKLNEKKWELDRL